MAVPSPSIPQLVKEGSEFYKQKFHSRPTVGGCAPGKVNLLGEHIDYNDGFVLPMGLPMVTIVLGTPNDEEQCVVYTMDKTVGAEDNITFPVPKDEPLQPGELHWANYVLGVVQNFKGTIVGFNAIIISSVPTGKGLGSSAALEVAFYTFLERLTNQMSDKREKAFACQKAEHEFAHVNCGIMDQFTSVMSKENNILLIDCQSTATKHFLFNEPNIVVLITDSNVAHVLGKSGGYQQRREDCEEALRIIDEQSYRNVSLEMIFNKKGQLTDTQYRRAKHVVLEIARVHEALWCLKKRDYNTLGLLMYQGHESLRCDFEVSCPETDSLVQIAKNCEGVYGSRMTGAGFGGCTVTLVKKEAVGRVINAIKAHYKGTAEFYIVTPSQGARCINITTKPQNINI